MRSGPNVRLPRDSTWIFVSKLVRSVTNRDTKSLILTEDISTNDIRAGDGRWSRGTLGMDFNGGEGSEGIETPLARENYCTVPINKVLGARSRPPDLHSCR